MGLPSPQDAAPAYDEVFADHPVNRFPGTGSSSAYAAVPQNDDVELLAHEHNHDATSPAAQDGERAPESFMQTLAGALRPKPHVHCEACDVQLAAKQRHSAQKHCCTMVATTFVVAFVCMFFGAVIISSIWRKNNRHHD